MKQEQSVEDKRALSVAFLIGQLGLGGSERQLYLLASELKSRGWQVSVLNLNPCESDYWVSPLKKLGLPVHDIPRNSTQLKRLSSLTLKLSTIAPNIVHSWSLYTNIYAVLCGIAAHVPVRLGSERGNREYSIKSYGNLRYNLSLMGLQGLVTNSPVEANTIIKKKPRLPVEYIPNGVETDELYDRSTAREYLGISDDCLLVAGIGSLTSNKNFEYLIRVFSQIQVRHPQAKLALIGDGPEKKHLLYQASSNIAPGRFILLGAIPEIYRLMTGVDILCVTSLTEGMPNVVLEACAAGTPIIANRIGAIPSIIKDGINGYLVDVGNVDQFTGALEKLLQSSSLRAEMGAAGKQLAQMEFSSRKMANRFITFYRKSLDFDDAQTA
jgi:glycosyltransferase involved in cell wall biosynthesis